MNDQRFQLPESLRLTARFGLGTWIVLVIGLPYLLLRFGPWWLAVVVAVVGLMALVQYAWLFTNQAWKINVLEDHIHAITSSGRDLRVAWGEIAEIRRFHRLVLGGRSQIVRLISRGEGPQIVVTSRLPGFDQLMEAIEVRTPLARRTSSPNRWERFMQL